MQLQYFLILVYSTAETRSHSTDNRSLVNCTNSSYWLDAELCATVWCWNRTEHAHCNFVVGFVRFITKKFWLKLSHSQIGTNLCERLPIDNNSSAAFIQMFMKTTTNAQNGIAMQWIFLINCLLSVCSESLINHKKPARSKVNLIDFSLVCFPLRSAASKKIMSPAYIQPNRANKKKPECGVHCFYLYTLFMAYTDFSKTVNNLFY